jgi:hypothetical protein
METDCGESAAEFSCTFVNKSSAERCSKILSKLLGIIVLGIHGEARSCIFWKRECSILCVRGYTALL